MNKSKALEVAAHLATLPYCDQIRPVEVTIGSQTFYGAQYRWGLPYEAGMDAVVRGDKQVSDVSYWRRFYLLGEVSDVFRKAGSDRYGESKVVFTYDGSEWYGGGGWTDFLLKPWKKTTANSEVDPKYHPFGPWHDISEWSVPRGNKIDEHADKPRKRVAMTVNYLD